MRKGSIENIVLRQSLIVTDTLDTVADKVTQPGDDGSANPQADEFINKDGMVNHIKCFGEIRQNHRPHIVDFFSTLVKSVEEIN